MKNNKDTKDTKDIKDTRNIINSLVEEIKTERHNYDMLENDYNILKIKYNNLEANYNYLLEKYNTKLDANKGIIIALGVFMLGAIFGYIEKLKYFIL